MRRIAVVVVLWACAQSVGARTIHVPSDAPTIMDAVTAAASGDTILLAPGTYTGAMNRNITFGGKSVVIDSEAGPQLTTIDAASASYPAFWLYSGEDSTAVIRGVTVTNELGLGAYVGGPSTSPTFEDCVFLRCGSSQFPGGAECYSAGRVTFLRCTFTDNGGAIMAEDTRLRVLSCTFSGNEAGEGAAVNVALGVWDYGVVIADCSFTGNTAASGGALCLGTYISRPGASSSPEPGMLANRGARLESQITVSRCIFRGNHATYDGGAVYGNMFSYSQCAWLNDCIFIGNSSQRGGAVADYQCLLGLARCVLVGNVADEGGGAYLWGMGGPWAIHSCTFAANAAAVGSAIAWRWSSYSDVRNTIIALGTGGYATTSDSGVPVIDHCLIFANAGGDMLPGATTANLYGDPLFCDLSDEDCSLCADSPCLPTGNAWGEPVGALGQGCGDCVTAIRASTWGSIKAMFR